MVKSRVLGHFVSKNEKRFHSYSILGKVVKLFIERNPNQKIMSVSDVIDGLNLKTDREKTTVRVTLAHKNNADIFQRVDRGHYKIQRYRTEWRKVRVAVK